MPRPLVTTMAILMVLGSAVSASGSPAAAPAAPAAVPSASGGPSSPGGGSVYFNRRGGQIQSSNARRLNCVMIKCPKSFTKGTKCWRCGAD